MGFKGCIRELVSENKDFQALSVDLAISGRPEVGRVFHNMLKCGCKDLECENGGSCEERAEDFRCECRIGFTGSQCQISGEPSSSNKSVWLLENRLKDLRSQELKLVIDESEEWDNHFNTICCVIKRFGLKVYESVFDGKWGRGLGTVGGGEGTCGGN